MKFKNIFAAGAALVLAGGLSAALSSCSEDLLGELTGDGTVAFDFTIDDVAATRAFGDTEGVSRITVYVYDTDGNFIESKNAAVGGLHGTVTLNLTRGMDYDLAFVALNNTSSSPYSVDTATGTLKVNYANMNGSSNELRRDNDLFYNVRKGYKAGSSNTESILLRRPLAQINLGSDDLDAQIVKDTYGSTWSSLYANIHINYAHSEFNILTGEVMDEAHEVTYTTHRMNSSSQGYLGDFPVPGDYKYLYSAYVLVGENSPLDEITLNVSKTKSGAPNQTLVIPNAPVKRNYRTNVYGSLLTSTSNWQISIDPLFGANNDQNIDVWTGNVEDPVMDADGNATIYNAAQLAGFAKLVNGGNNFAGKTVTLKSDLYLGGRNWTPIGTSAATPFNGTFDGGNYTVHDLAVKVNADKPAGLFGSVRGGGTVKNLAVDGASINALSGTPSDDDNAGAAVVVGHAFQAAPIENITVKNATVDAYHWAGSIVGNAYVAVNNCSAEDVSISLECFDLGTKWDYGDKAGAIAGYIGEGDSYSAKDNSAVNVKISGYRHLGGLFGYINAGDNQNAKVISGNSVSDAVIWQDCTHNYKGIANGALVGEIAGYINSNVSQSGNTSSRVSIIVPSTVSDVAGLVAAVQNGGIITIDEDLDLSQTSGQIYIGKPTVINLNGKTLKTKGSSVYVGDELTVKGDGEIVSDGFTIIGEAGSTIIIKDGEVSTTSTSQYNQAINTSGDLIMTGGTVKGGQNAPAITLNWANENNSVYKVEISGGEIITNNEYALNIVGSSDSNHVQEAVINGGVFVGNSGVRADGYVNVTINGGYFIQESVSSHGHAYCAGAETSRKGTVTTINGGYFYGSPGQAICNAGNAKTIVNAAFVNKTLGTNSSSFTLGSNSTFTTLATPVSKTINGKTYTFGYQVK